MTNLYTNINLKKNMNKIQNPKQNYENLHSKILCGGGIYMYV